MFWAILGATIEEIEFIFQNLDNIKEHKWNQNSIFQGKIKNHPILTLSTGIGKVKASTCLQYLVDHFPIKNIIFSGVAGAINPKRDIGDIIIGTKSIQHDFRLKGSDTPPKKLCWLKSSPELVKRALRAGKGLKFKEKIVTGSIITGDQAIKSAAQKKWLWNTFAADCVDMESAAIAMVSSMNHIPFVPIRSISDQADENTSRDFSKSFIQAAANAAAIAIEMVNH
jgi:adenosylhomocysteine nucleosidase